MGFPVAFVVVLVLGVVVVAGVVLVSGVARRARARAIDDDDLLLALRACATFAMTEARDVDIDIVSDIIARVRMRMRVRMRIESNRIASRRVVNIAASRRSKGHNDEL